MKRNYIHVLTMASLGVLISCNPQTTTMTADQQTAQTRMDTIQQQAAETEKRYNNYPQDSLLEALHTDSKKMREPFNSLAYRELLKRKNTDPAKLIQSVNTSDYTSLLNLLAARSLAKEQYRQIPANQKISILVDALSQSKTFNTWGLPHLHLEDASNALIEIGDTAIARIAPLLNDCRKALVWGDEEYYEYKKFQYRLCDFAMIFIKRIRGEQFMIPEKPEERDRLIAQIKNAEVK